ncbi:ArsR family transcriptional regulator [Candidatus Bathyarchaeota archaeon CG07_land_8_20_14_0_80_47_9]|nr:MAG: ArsR family transcriptional regulator [Candidatus Bathyarchaeota archaeon CG07_land_8_20_14_0_80_47_9]
MNESKDILRGLTLKVYRFILKNDKPVGIREVQRALNLSSPTLALYHINKLEEAGFIKKELNGYVADRIILENLIRLRGVLIPRNFFYTVFLVTSLIFLVVFLRPSILTREYIFSLGVVSVAAATSVYETIKALSEKVL